MSRRINTKEAAERLKSIGLPFTAGTLMVWRSQGRGPRFYRIGRNIFYDPIDLDEFAKGQVIETINSIEGRYANEQT